MKYILNAIIVAAILTCQEAQSFTNQAHSHPKSFTILSAAASSSKNIFELEVNMPPSNSGLAAQMKIQSVLDKPSEIVEVRYKLPFGLDVQPKDGLAVCTKDSSQAGGEKVGDVLRFTSQWTLGLPRGNGLVSTAASFSGAIGWQCSLFDVMKAGSWEEVVESLTSNTPERTDEVMLLFERPLLEE
mmetsp:Transcript_6660/g.8424  ORF Transcript_6660/g.8424 Transcript_6660/m.8424 type:complete len:186 (-) Transcript_6660:185-742(-)